MKKGFKKVYSNQELLSMNSELQAKKYAENTWKDLKERYKHHKTTSYYAFKDGIMHALSNPDLLSLIDESILTKAGLLKKKTVTEIKTTK